MEEFCSFTNAEPHVAKQYLINANYNVKVAVLNYFIEAKKQEEERLASLEEANLMQFSRAFSSLTSEILHPTTPSFCSDNQRVKTKRGSLYLIQDYVSSNDSNSSSELLELGQSLSQKQEEKLDVINETGVPPFFQQISLAEKNKIKELLFPASTVGRCSKSVEENLNYLHKMKSKGCNLLSLIQERKNYKNPSAYKNLVSFLDIEEHGSNFPQEMLKPSFWGPESFYEELAKRQDEEMKKRKRIIKKK